MFDNLLAKREAEDAVEKQVVTKKPKKEETVLKNETVKTIIENRTVRKSKRKESSSSSSEEEHEVCSLSFYLLCKLLFMIFLESFFRSMRFNACFFRESMVSLLPNNLCHRLHNRKM